MRGFRVPTEYGAARLYRRFALAASILLGWSLVAAPGWREEERDFEAPTLQPIERPRIEGARDVPQRWAAYEVEVVPASVMVPAEERDVFWF